MIDIYKASAGSGKTYRLSKTYRDLLLKADSDDAYRHILAVTFTNKSTAEMKKRILKDLYESKGLSKKEKDRSKRILVRILHDYGAFAVSTIDRFFQQALRAFTRELGHSSNYQIELDKKSLMNEAMDRIMDDIKPEDTELLSWFNREISSRLDEGSKPKIEQSLYDMSELLGKAEETYGKNGNAISRNTIAELQKDCALAIANYVDKVRSLAKEIFLPPGMKSIKTVQSAVNKLNAWDGKSIKDILLSDTSITKLTEQGYSAIVDTVNPSGAEFKTYNTAQTILKTTFVLGIAGEFFAKLTELEDEKNVLCLDQTTALLRDIIDGSDAPFVYEKIGVRYNHFLLDEFQDTSSTQWDNFQPLLENSVAQACDNIVVGDVKQSIYRFRGSDWKLLDSTIDEVFKGDTILHNLNDNYRSDRAIVEFNNDFFVKASNRLGKDKLYSDVRQNVIHNEHPGYVTTDFCKKKDEILDTTLHYVQDALKQGAKASDIGILVRNKKDGAEVARMLIENGYGVVSDDSLLLSSSPVVRQAVSVLYAIEDPSNSLESYIYKKLDIAVDKSYHSIVDLCDRIFMALKKRDTDTFNGQTLFIQSFMDAVLNWTNIYGNNLKAFLKYWEDNIEELVINSPEDPASIRITTVHKSKGLAFPVVIFPFAEHVVLFKEEKHWCKLNENSGFLGGKYDHLSFPVSLSGSMENSFFSDTLHEVQDLQTVDNLNIFYVCLTRAKNQMHIIAKEPSETIKKSGDAKCMTDILYACYGNSRFGEPYDFAVTKKEEKTDVEVFPAGYDSFPMNPDPSDERLKPSDQSWDFFGEEGIGTSKRLDGIRLHEILSGIENIDKMARVIKYQDNETKVFLESRINSQKQWFDPELKVLNETEIITVDGKTCRPDRVVIDKSGKVSIIDFKFGNEEKGHHKQVASYMEQYKAMGYKNVEGYLWYVRDDKVVII